MGPKKRKCIGRKYKGTNKCHPLTEVDATSDVEIQEKEDQVLESEEEVRNNSDATSEPTNSDKPLEIEILCAPNELETTGSRRKRTKKDSELAINRDKIKDKSEFDWNSKLAPTAHQLRNFERDPRIALLNCAANSGQGRFLATDHDDILNNVPSKIEEIKKEIEENLSRRDIGDIFQRFKKNFDKDARLLACGSCGVREYEMGDKKMELVHLLALSHLQLKEEERLAYLALPENYRKVCSVYTTPGPDDEQLLYYHLHPELVTGETVRLCKTCYNSALPKRGAPKIPKFSLAAGIDFGVIERLGFPPLTLVEELLLSRSRLFVNMVKLVGPTAPQRQVAKNKSHVITFPAPDGPTKLVELQRLNSSHDRDTYPRIENLKEHLGVFFLGSRLQWDSLVPFHEVQELQVRVEVVYKYLHLLKSVNPLYSDVNIDESEAMKTSLGEITSQLLDLDSGSAFLMDEKIDKANEKAAESVQDSDSLPAEELCDIVEDNSPLQSSFVSRLTPLDRDPHKSTRTALQGMMATMGSQVSNVGSLLNDKQGTSHETILDNLLQGSGNRSPNHSNNYMSDNDDDNEDVPPIDVHQIQIPRELILFNEFNSNDKLIYSSFPHLFLFGRGLRSSGSVNEEATRHMMLQFSGSISLCHRLIFLLFDQFQRHAATRVIASRVKCSPKSFGDFVDWINEPDFLEELKAAVKNPKAPSSIELLKKLGPNIQSCTSRIPFTSSQRGASMRNLVAMRYYFGMPSFFFTYSPDDINGVLNIRLSIGQQSNEKFPADGTGFANAIQKGDAFFYKIPILPQDLRAIVSKGPIAAAEIFRLMTEAVFTDLLGTPPDHSSKRTTPLSARKRGAFGVGVASFGSVEEQARGSLHLHVVCWAGLPPHLLQSAALNEILIEAVAKSLDMLIKAEVEPEIHVEHLLNKCKKRTVEKPSLATVHHPDKDPVSFKNDAHRAAVVCNLHQHSSTCHSGNAGKKGCRLSRPQALVEKTGCCQLNPKLPSPENPKSYEVLPDVEPPAPDSRRSRNISRMPIPLHDGRLIMWEMERKPIKPIRQTDSTLPQSDSSFLRLPLHLRAEFEELEPEQQKQMNDALVLRNGLIVEFNELVSAHLGCNSNVGLLGSEEQSKNSLCYLLKYVTKSTTGIIHSASLILAARRHIEAFPSVAEDTGTDERTAMQLLNRVTNKISCAIEVSSHMAALAILGAPSEFVSCSFQKVFIQEAATYALRHPSFNDCEPDDDMEFRDLPGDEWIEEGEEESDEDDPLHEEDELYEEDFNPRLMEMLGEEEYVDSDLRYSSATIYTGSTGKVAVPQHVHYSFRGQSLADFTLYEWTSCVDVIPKPKKKKKAEEEDIDDEEEPFEEGDDHEGDEFLVELVLPQKRAAGRPANGCYDFAEGHPLFDTHTQRLRSKPKVPVPRRSPRPPPPKPRRLTVAWKKQAREFAQHVLVVFRPWRAQIEGGGTLPESLKWRSYCSYTRDLEDGADGLGPSFLDEVRTRWIRSMAYGMRTTNRSRVAVQEFRGRARKIWGASTEVPEPSVFNDHEREEIEEDREDEDESHLAEIAQLNLAILQAEAEDLDLLGSKVEVANFLAKTKASLQNFTNPADPDPSGLGLNNGDGIALVHEHLDMETQAEDILEKLRLTNTPEEMGEEEFDQYLEEATAVCIPDPIAADADPNSLNTGQRKIYNNFRRFLLDKKDAIETGCDHPDPLQYLIHGGPGTGKSYMVKCIHKMASDLGFSLLCLAPTGIAASNLPKGKTIHSAFNFTIAMKTGEFLVDLTTDQLNRLKHQMNTDKLTLVIIDEISYVMPEMLAQIDNRLRQIMSSPEKSFGGLSVAAMGDFFQLPPVKERSLFASTWKQFCLDTPHEDDGAETPFSRGVKLFAKLQKFDLLQQMRAAEDPSHTEMLNRMGSPIPTDNRVDRRAIKALKPITSKDFKENPDWLRASLVVTSNRERHLINNLRSKQWAVSSGNQGFIWENPLLGFLASKVQAPIHKHLYENYEELSGCFVAGAPGFLTENINPGRGLSNGTPIVYHSLTLNPKEPNIERIRNLVNSNSQQDIKLVYPPSYIHVMVPGANIDDFVGSSLFPGQVIIPIPVSKNPDIYNIQLPGQVNLRQVKVKAHSVEMAFAVTVHKMQGQTKELLIIDLNHRPSPTLQQIIFQGLYVALSRVKKSSNIRIMPLHNPDSLEYLYSLNLPPFLNEWLSGFDCNGIWSASEAMRKIPSPTTSKKPTARPSKKAKT